MNGKEELERIRKRFEETENAGAFDVFDKDLFYKDMRTLINIIDAMDKRQQQEKFKLNSLYLYKTTESINKEKNYKNVDVYIDRINSKLEDYIENEKFNADIKYINVDVEIKENILKITPSDTKGDFLSIYSINNLGRIRIRPNEDKIKSKYFTREQIEDTIHSSVSDYDCLIEKLNEMMYPEEFEKMKSKSEVE